MIVNSYQDAKSKFLLGDYSVEKYFKQNNFLLESAYCNLLLGNLENAQIEMLKLVKFDLRADWASKLIQFMDCCVKDLPSYFQIRNFLEIDLDLLIQAGQAQFVENIINGADLFYSVNPESYKFISRVMYNNDFIDVALYYLQKAKEKFYYDPEMHFMFANCYLINNDFGSAKEALTNCLNILPEYTPAKKLLCKLES